MNPLKTHFLPSPNLLPLLTPEPSPKQCKFRDQARSKREGKKKFGESLDFEQTFCPDDGLSRKYCSVLKKNEKERSEIHEKIKENMHVNSSRLHIYVHKKKTDPTQQTFFQHDTYICILASDQMRKSSISHSWKAHLALASNMFVCFVSLFVSSFFSVRCFESQSDKFD